MDKVNQYIDRNRWIELLLFIIIFWLFIVNLHLNRGLEDMIPGYHYWRKTDTYAQIMNYYFNGLNFFDHGIYYNQMNSGGKAVAEFPLFYYLVAIQKKIFGNHDLILKINWIVVMFFGQFALYKTAIIFTKNHFLSLAVPFVLFLSPTYVIYCIEFLPDPIALHFGFTGFYFISNFFIKKKKKDIIWGLIFVSISGMMKPFFLVPYIAFLLTYFVVILVKKQSVKNLFIWFTPLLMVGVWFLYVSWYNKSVNSHYFLSKLKPIWSESIDSISRVWEKIVSKWMNTYFHESFYIILLLIAILAMILSFRKSWTKTVFFIICFVGASSFFLLLYGMFLQHDYYIFPVLFLAPLTILYFSAAVSSRFNFWVTSGLGVVLILGIYLGSGSSWLERNRRLKTPRISAMENFKPYQNLDSFLSRHGVGKEDLVFAFSDKSPSYALMLLNRRGWSGFQTYYRPHTVEKLMDKGLKYAIINEAISPKKDSLAFESVNLQYIADTNNIFIYKLTK